MTIWDIDEPVTGTKLNKGAIFYVENKTALKALDSTPFFNENMFRLPDDGFFVFNTSTPVFEDGDLILESDKSGHYKVMATNGDRAAIYLAPDIQETLPTVTASLDFSSISANSASSDLSIEVLGARPDDIVICQKPPLNDGIILQDAWVSSDDNVAITLYNTTSGSINPSAGTFTVYVIKRDRLPVITPRGHQFYEDMQDPDTYTDTELEADLVGDTVNQMHFFILLASTWRRASLLDDADIKAVIQASTTANDLMELYEGPGY